MSYLTPEIVAGVTDVEAAFGGGVEYLPPMADIPTDIESSPFYRLAMDLFYEGQPTDKTPRLVLKKEYEPVSEKIPLFARSILGSFQPKHEHKMGGMAMLFAEMFEEPKK